MLSALRDRNENVVISILHSSNVTMMTNSYTQIAFKKKSFFSLICHFCNLQFSLSHLRMVARMH